MKGNFTKSPDTKTKTHGIEFDLTLIQENICKIGILIPE